MTWDIPYRWGGPVLAWELRRLDRQRWPWLLFFVFLAFCVAQVFVLYASFLSKEAAQRQATQTGGATSGFVTTPPRDSLTQLNADNQARMLFAGKHLARFFPQQLLFLLFITPAVTAGALGHEKEKDTLNALFCSELADREIVIGKVLGRLWVLIKFMLISMPVAFGVAGFAGVDLTPILLCYLHALVITYALAGVCIFCSVITRRTRDAIMACYSTIVLLILAALTLTGKDPLPLWLNPVEIVVGISTPPFTSINPRTVLIHFIVFAFMGWLFVWLSQRLIRPMGLRQLEDRSSRWKWAIRSGVGNDPFRWRERHILGLAPLQALRSMPTWLGWAGVFGFSVSLVLGLLNAAVHGNISHHFLRGEWGYMVDNLIRAVHASSTSDVILMGVLLIVFATVTVTVRCAGAVTEEKRRKTWEDLVMTGTPVDRITESKMWGVFLAAIPYLFLYSIPMFAYAIAGGTSALLAALITFGLSWVCTLGGAMVGISISLAEKDRHEVVRSRRRELELLVQSHRDEQVNSPAHGSHEIAPSANGAPARSPRLQRGIGEGLGTNQK